MFKPLIKNLFPIVIMGLFLTSCGTGIDIPTISPEEEFAADVSEIETYLMANGLPVQATESGLHYIVEEIGNGATITGTDTVNLLLQGYFLNGESRGAYFDSTGSCSPATFAVSNVIPGFNEGIQLFRVGGKGSLFLPSRIAFGQTGNAIIPANSVIAFDFEVVDQKSFDQAKINDYLATNNLTPTDSTESGIKYIITNSGTGASPSDSSIVTVKYRGYFSNGTEFDANESATFGLDRVIAGWRESVPLLKIGGTGTFLIPSDLAYGPSGNAAIPSNTMIIFDIELLSFQ